MSNMGFYKALEDNGMTSVQTAVGDRYVVEEMRAHDYNVGGEQSGHIVFLDYNTTGDGLLTGIQLVNIMKATGKRLSELAGEMTIFPQKLVNVRVTDKHAVTQNEKVAAVIAEVEAKWPEMAVFLFVLLVQSRLYVSWWKHLLQKRARNM